jgi:hypothetical protein
MPFRFEPGIMKSLQVSTGEKRVTTGNRIAMISQILNNKDGNVPVHHTMKAYVGVEVELHHS